MSRSVHWRKTISDSCCWHQSQALNSTIYILRQTGPTGFLLQEEGETMPVKVYLGDPHSCTCPVFKKERDLCKHICWVLLRKFRLPVHDPMSWQLGLVEREINEILRGRITSDQNQTKQHQKSANVIESSDGRTIVEQREIANDDVCPICQEELLAKKLLVTYCKYGCGNSIHIKCMKVWAEHQLKTSEENKIKCPMCREDFGTLDNLKTEMKNAGYVAPPAPGIRLDKHIGVACSQCRISPIEGKCYRCTVCSGFFLCQKCFNMPLHTDHSFQFRQKRNQRWNSASRILGSCLPSAIANDLMHREISDNDYDLLIQLERNSQSDLSCLTEEALKCLPVECVKETGPLLATGYQCRVCLRGFVVGQLVRKLPCKHKFHKDCIDSWLLHSYPTCPIDGILAVNNQGTQQNAHRNVLQNKTSNNEQSHSNNQDSGGLILTAFGIPISSSRASATRKKEEVINQERRSSQQLHQNPYSATRLELSSLPFDNGNPFNQIHQIDTKEHPKQCILQQALQRKARIKHDFWKMGRKLSALSNENDLLTPGAFIQCQQADSPSRPMTTPFDGHNTYNSSVISAKSAVPLPLARMPVSQMKYSRPFLRRPRSLTYNKPHSLPSIQNVREVVGELYLGNNPETQPAVKESWITPKPLVNQRSRTQALKSVLHNHLTPIRPLKSVSQNMDIRLDGGTFEYNENFDEHTGDG